MSDQTYVKLNNGVEMPMAGIGTFMLSPDEAENSVVSALQAGNVVIPGSKNPEHIRANFDLFDFGLTEEEMAQIAAINKDKRYYYSTPEMLDGYARMVPPVDEQK